MEWAQAELVYEMRIHLCFEVNVFSLEVTTNTIGYGLLLASSSSSILTVRGTKKALARANGQVMSSVLEPEPKIVLLQ